MQIILWLAFGYININALLWVTSFVRKESFKDYLQETPTQLVIVIFILAGPLGLAGWLAAAEVYLLSRIIK